MKGNNATIAGLFNKIADLLEIQQANRFRVRAYRNAARVIIGLPQEIGAMLADGADLTDLPGIGADLAAKIIEIHRTGRCKILQKLERQVPGGLADLLALPGLGPMRVRQLHSRFGIKGIADLKRVIAGGEISRLKGFGTKTIAGISEALSQPSSQQGRRILWAKADEIAQSLVSHLKGADGLTKVVVAGSYRRHAETVGDLDILATAPQAAPVIRRLLAFPDVARVVAKGGTRAAVILESGLQIDLRVVPVASYGAALTYFTGSKAHNLALRRRALSRSLKINEYGVFKGERRVGGKTEAEVYASVRLPYIEPELRENRGELEAAADKRLPHLIERGDIKGDLHVHTAASDGTATVRQMAEAARSEGLSYIAIADHTQSLRVAHGLDAKRLRKQFAEIDGVNAALRNIKILKAAEVDISPNGKLDLPDDVLAELDLAVCAVHSAFGLGRDKQTERIIRAMDHPACAILAHPTARLIGERAALDIDVERVLAAGKERHVIMELNCQPERLDLSDIYCRLAKEMGVKIAISSDAHSPLQFNFLAYGIGQARRGWLEAGDVVNTQPWTMLKKHLRRKNASQSKV